MNKQIILACDDNGKFLEYILKEKGHTGKGQRHLAIAALLYNSKGEVLLQKRKHKIFDNIWDLTAATHPLHKSDSSDETIEEATLRCLQEEWEIDKVENLKRVGVFNYFAQYGKLCENEHCYLIVGEYDGGVNLDQNIGYEYKWIKRGDFLADIAKNPQNYTPWAREAAELLTR
ncbi:NUDIX domain-containing protein [Candidatus Daviesbacteria bacterium]|nr:NUDIX domain-containing protein [Candidatus Daviesbacteria bacterium]